MFYISCEMVPWFLRPYPKNYSDLIKNKFDVLRYCSNPDPRECIVAHSPTYIYLTLIFPMMAYQNPENVILFANLH